MKLFENIEPREVSVNRSRDATIWCIDALLRHFGHAVTEENRAQAESELRPLEDDIQNHLGIVKCDIHEFDAFIFFGAVFGDEGYLRRIIKKHKICRKDRIDPSVTNPTSYEAMRMVFEGYRKSKDTDALKAAADMYCLAEYPTD